MELITNGVLLRKFLGIAIVLAASACGTEKCDDDFYTGADGYPSDGDSSAGEGDVADAVVDAIDALPSCVPLPGNGRLDFEKRCADNGCIDDTYTDLVDAFGANGFCEPSFSWSDRLSCGWFNTIRVYFDDNDLDGIPDEFDAATAIYIDDTWDGTTDSGLGIGVSMRCFLDEYGVPDELDFRSEDGVIQLTGFEYIAIGLDISASSSEIGIVDGINLKD